LKSKINFNKDETQGTIICNNDSLIVTMVIQPFEVKKHNVQIDILAWRDLHRRKQYRDSINRQA
jgi:hypothetical protein